MKKGYISVTIRVPKDPDSDYFINLELGTKNESKFFTWDVRIIYYLKSDL
ncbi:MAG: hypothetical protein HeimC3_50830 [Candidatus Heimdallarchaeota archaeon LC_3]|nr:MAG: hypothetical protein HeimC3_50830 [Candidatus Heimdallarchaeota archaeon LC_3]